MWRVCLSVARREENIYSTLHYNKMYHFPFLHTMVLFASRSKSMATNGKNDAEQKKCSHDICYMVALISI